MSAKNYQTLQKSIDKVVGKIGLDKTIHLLESFISNTYVKHTQQEKVRMVTQYLISLAVKEFELEDELFFHSNVREYRDARMCCFHLLRKYTEDTLPKIGLMFQCSERTVEYGCGKASERLAVPQGNTRFVTNYIAIEARLLEFIGRIN